VADGTTLVVADSIAIQAAGDSKQYASSDSNTYGLIAAGGNVSDAVST
jgi:phosphopentomutase